MPLPEINPTYLTLRESGDALVVGFTLKRITEDENVQQLGHELFSLSEQYGYLMLVLDLDGVEYMTSSVIGKLITLHRKLHREGGMLVLCRLSKGVGDVLHTSRLIDYFATADDVDGALARLAAGDETS